LGVISFTLLMSTKHPNLVKIGKKIREMRKLKHFSQEQLAVEAELGRSYLGRIERGEQNISIQNLIQIALTLRIEVGELIPSLRQLKSSH
jgi:transcriptional regulator with XRE-family HTH domain